MTSVGVRSDSEINIFQAKPKGAALSIIEPVTDLIARFPATRYYGSKRKLLPWLYGHLGPLQFNTVLDAFGGTASVSLLFKSMRKNVTYHDGFHFNEDVAKTVLSKRPALSRENVEAVMEAVTPRSGTISKFFNGIFFEDQENAWLDGFISHILTQPNTRRARALLRYLMYQACLKKRPFNLFHRANLGLRTNQDVKRTFGNAVTWERSFAHHAMQAYDELSNMPSTFGPTSTILPAGDASSIAAGYDLVYIDPPYVGPSDRCNRDDYWRRYHFLEGLARYEPWADLIDRSSDVRLFPPSHWFTEWGRKATFKDRLFSLINTHRHSIVALSYVSHAIPSETEILSYFEDRFHRVSLHSAAHNHALSKGSKRELLYVGLPK